MKNTISVLAIVAVAAMATTACNASGGEGCGKDQTKVPEGAFCITIPAGFEPAGVEKEDGKLQVNWHPSAGGQFSVDIYPEKEMPADMSKAISHSRGETVTTGDIAGGKGRWIMAVDSTKYGIYRLNVKGSKGLIECSVNASLEQMTKELNICKSITLM